MSSLSYQLGYVPSDKQNSDYYELLLHYLISNDDIFNTVGNNNTQVVLDQILAILLDDNIIDKLKELDKELNIKFDSSDKDNFDKYTHLFQLCNYITDYKESNKTKKEELKTRGYDFSDDDDYLNVSENEDYGSNSENESGGKSTKKTVRYLPEDKDVSSEDSASEDENEDEDVYLPNTVDLIDKNKVVDFIIYLFKIKKEDSLLNSILNLLLQIEDFDELSRSLHKIVNVTRLRSIPKLLAKKDLINYGLQYNLSTAEEDKNMIVDELKAKNLLHLLPVTSNKRKHDGTETFLQSKRAKRLLNLNKYRLPLDDDLLITKKEIKLPENSYKINKDNYTELHIPPPEKPELNFNLVDIKSLPTWAQAAFPVKETTTLNRIQSEVYPVVFHTNENMLVCAPTGAGKTNIAVLSILHTVSKYVNERGRVKQDSSFKCVYIAPLKALVQEQVTEFQRRLEPFGINVVELTGDSDTSRKELANGHIIVSTPEKWDIISRKFSNRSLIKQCQLMILDEVHLLHEERGPIIEAISIRMLDNACRIVALSATLPNYQDVADFLRVGPKGLFYFTPDFRPCPLKQEFIAVKGGQNNPVKELININKACYEKVAEHLKQGFQIIVFVHSRKDTVKTGKFILESLTNDKNMKTWIDQQDPSTKNIMAKESENCENSDLSYLIKNGIAIHHAGLSRNDRSQSEDLFADGVIKLLVSTKTISWGVNLPAHTVIIKGTDIYSPPLSKWVKLSIQDMLQMLGRAGRPRYDTYGEGIIITNQLGVNHYLALLMDQMNIESRFLDRVVDLANAEICAGSIKTRSDMTAWFKKTYWFIRMNKDRKMYKTEGLNIDVFLQMVADSVLDTLKNNEMCTLDSASSDEYSVNSTKLALIASDFYIAHESIFNYFSNLDKDMSMLEVFQLFSKSKEFENMAVRAEEKYEMKILLSKLPLPVRESFEDVGCKPNALLQSYISRLSMDGLSLNADMIFIKQNSQRLFQALLEISKLKKLSNLVKMLMNIIKYVENRVWLTNTPLRQFNLEPKLIKKIETCYLDWDTLINTSEGVDYSDVLLQMAPSLSDDLNVIAPCVSKFPKFNDIGVSLQPLTKTLYSVNIVMTPRFKWDYKLHKSFLPFLVILEDCSGEKILYQNSIRIKPYNIGNEVSLQFDLELTTSNLQPNLFLNLISETWLHCKYKAPVLIMNEIKQIDKLLPAPTKFSDSKLREIKTEVNRLDVNEFSTLCDDSSAAFDSEVFNMYQNDAVQVVLRTTDNILMCSPPNTGKTLIAKMAMLKSYQLGHSRIAYINNDNEKLAVLKEWLLQYYPHENELLISQFENGVDNKKAFDKSHIILSTFENFELVSRDWKNSENFQSLNLVILDDLEAISGNNDPYSYIYETLISRLTLMETQLEKGLRLIALGNSISNYIEVGEWLGVERDNCFNYANDTLIESSLGDIDMIEYSDIKTDFNVAADKVCDEILIKVNSSDVTSKKLKAVIYVTDRVSALKTAEIVLSKQAVHDKVSKLAGISEELLSMFTDSAVGSFFANGISIFYWNMDPDDKRILQKFIKSANFVISDGSTILCSDIVFINGTEYNKEVSSCLGLVKIEPFKFMNMVTSCSNNGSLRILTANKLYFNKLLTESQFSVESSIPYHFTELLINEINAGIIEKKTDILEWFSYTFFNTRIHSNPSFYGVKDNEGLTLSKFVTSLIENSLFELKELELLEDEKIVNDEGEDDLKLELGKPSLSVSELNLHFEDFELLFVNLPQGENILQFLEIVSSLPSLETLATNYLGSFEQINKVAVNKEVAAYKHKLSPQVFKVFYLLYSLLKEGSSQSLSVALQLDLKSIVKHVVLLLNKVLKMYILLQSESKVSMKRLDLLLKVIKGLTLEIPIFNESFEKGASLLQIPYITEAQIEVLTHEKQIFTVEEVISNDLNSLVNDDGDEDVDEFLAMFPLAKLTHKFENDLEIIVENINKDYKDAQNHGGDYYCTLRSEGSDTLIKIIKVVENGVVIIKRSDLPSGPIIIELINSSFITAKQVVKVFN